MCVETIRELESHRAEAVASGMGNWIERSIHSYESPVGVRESACGFLEAGLIDLQLAVSEASDDLYWTTLLLQLV